MKRLSPRFTGVLVALWLLAVVVGEAVGQAPAVAAPVAPEAAFTLEGKVTEVNSQFGFVVVELGAGHGVKKGSLVQVSREDRTLGSFRVIELGPTWVIAEGEGNPSAVAARARKGDRGVVDLRGAKAPASLLDRGAPAEAAPAVAPAPVAPAVPLDPSLKTKVIAVNRDFGFIVIGVGSAVGVRPGMQFLVVRDEQVIARLQADEVQGGLTATTVVPGSLVVGEVILLGDGAVPAPVNE